MGGFFLSVLLLSILVFPGETLCAQEARAVLDKYLENVSTGDWDRIKAAYIESIGSYSQRDFDKLPTDFAQAKPKTNKLYVIWPYKCRADLFEDSILVTSVYHNKNSHYVVMPNMVPIPIAPSENEPFYEFFPVTLKRMLGGRHSLSLINTSHLDGSEYYHIQLESKRVIWDLHFNTETYLLEYWSNSLYEGSTTLTKIGGYKKFDEYLIPTMETKSKDGVMFFWSEIKEIKFNVEFDDKLFQLKEK